MEMQQVEYFLAAAVEQSFAMAAERCGVSATELARGIDRLEEEFGGDLFICERLPLQLTELGQCMHRRMKQIYDSAVAARSLAAVRSGEVGSLRLALSHSVALGLLAPYPRAQPVVRLPRTKDLARFGNRAHRASENRTGRACGCLRCGGAIRLCRPLAPVQ